MEVVRYGGAAFCVKPDEFYIDHISNIEPKDICQANVILDTLPQPIAEEIKEYYKPFVGIPRSFSAGNRYCIITIYPKYIYVLSKNDLFHTRYWLFSDACIVSEHGRCKSYKKGEWLEFFGSRRYDFTKFVALLMAKGVGKSDIIWQDLAIWCVLAVVGALIIHDLLSY